MLSEFLLSHMASVGIPPANAPGHAAAHPVAGGRGTPPPLAGLPLNRQLYEALRRAMLDGKLSAGERLPSTRDLAQDLGLSRNTVMAAIGQLTVEGYLVSQVGSGTYVADSVPAAQLYRPPLQAGTAPPLRHGNLSDRGHALAHSFNASQLEVQQIGRAHV